MRRLTFKALAVFLSSALLSGSLPAMPVGRPVQPVQENFSCFAEQAFAARALARGYSQARSLSARLQRALSGRDRTLEIPGQIDAFASDDFGGTPALARAELGA